MGKVVPFDDPITSRELAQHLRRMMALQGATPLSLSRLLGVDQGTVNAWCHGRNLRKVVGILAAFEALGCTIKIVPPRRNSDKT